MAWEAIISGKGHVYYGLFILGVFALVALIFDNYILYKLTSIVALIVVSGVAVDLFVHGYTHSVPVLRTIRNRKHLLALCLILQGLSRKLKRLIRG